MNLSSDAYRSMTETALALADECCGGRLVIVHEGGYSQTYVPVCTLAVIETLAGVTEPWPDPALNRLRQARTSREVGLDAERAIAAVLDTQRAFWSL
jgi:acetoin utilization deacetylase AcuC-like enzyme